MENSKIILYLKKQYFEVDYQKFIDQYTLNNFHYNFNKKDIMERLLFKPLKIEDDNTKEKIIISFKQKVIEEIEYIQNSKNFNEKYKDKLYNFLVYMSFHNCEQSQKLNILKMLNVQNFFISTILKDFTLKN